MDRFCPAGAKLCVGAAGGSTAVAVGCLLLKVWWEMGEQQSRWAQAVSSLQTCELWWCPVPTRLGSSQCPRACTDLQCVCLSLSQKAWFLHMLCKLLAVPMLTFTSCMQWDFKLSFNLADYYHRHLSEGFARYSQIGLKFGSHTLLRSLLKQLISEEIPNLI